MSLTRRWLPVQEWSKLDPTELAGYAPHMDPKRTRVAAIERDSELVACVAFMRIIHAEGLWVKEGPWKREAWQLLCEAMTEAGTDEGVRAMMAMANRDTMRRILTRHHGQLLPGDHYALPVPFGPFEES